MHGQAGSTSRSTAAPIRTVVVTHRGEKPYLATCMRRAVEAVGPGRAILLGDAANADLGLGEHHSIHDPSLQTDLDEFRGVYRQVSRSHSFAIERFWLERWFLIRNFLRREGLDGCLAIDSDVLLFCDVGQESLRFFPYAMTFGRWDAVRVVPHCNFIRGVDALDDFCRYVIDLYRSPDDLRRVAEINRKKFNSSWISDMSLLASWATRGHFPVGFLEDTIAAGVGFDSCLDETSTFRGCGFLPGILRQWKKIVFRDGVPHCVLRASGLVVPMRCIHYHGGMKLLMARHDRCENDDWTAAGMLLKQKLGNLPGKAQLFYRNYLAPWPPAARPDRRPRRPV